MVLDEVGVGIARDVVPLEGENHLHDGGVREDFLVLHEVLLLHVVFEDFFQVQTSWLVVFGVLRLLQDFLL